MAFTDWIITGPYELHTNGDGQYLTSLSGGTCILDLNSSTPQNFRVESTLWVDGYLGSNEELCRSFLYFRREDGSNQYRIWVDNAAHGDIEVFLHKISGGSTEYFSRNDWDSRRWHDLRFDVYTDLDGVTHIYAWFRRHGVGHAYQLVGDYAEVSGYALEGHGGFRIELREGAAIQNLWIAELEEA